MLSQRLPLQDRISGQFNGLLDSKKHFPIRSLAMNIWTLRRIFTYESPVYLWSQTQLESSHTRNLMCRERGPVFNQIVCLTPTTTSRWIPV